MERDAYLALIRDDSNRVMENVFMFQNPWDMERTDFPVAFNGPIDWAFEPKGDPEWTFMLARHSFIFNLAKAEYFFGNAEYGDKALSLIRDFIVNAPCTEERKNTSWRSLDAAIRVTNWIDAIEILEKTRGVKLQDAQIAAGIKAHVEYLKGFDNTFLKLSNWGAIGNAGLFRSSCYLGDGEGIERAHSLFLETLVNQIHPDGFQWEQSSMYQAEVLLHTLDYIRTARRYDIALEPEILNCASLMAHAFLDMRKPDGKQFMQSDSDSTDLEDILSKAAFVLSDGMLKWAVDGQLDHDYAITATEAEIRSYRMISMIRPDYTSASYDISGHTYLRNSWGPEGSVVHIKTASHGGGHGHGDILHVDACLNGEDVLVDSGRYTYVDSPIRKMLKLASHHNTILIDGREPFVPTDSWGYSRYSRGMGMPTVFRNDWNNAGACFLGYMDIGVLPLRQVLLLDDVLVLLDGFKGPGTHKVTRPFIFDEHAGIQAEDGFFRFGDFAVFSDSRCRRMERYPISYRYNTLGETDALILEDEMCSNEMRYLVIGKHVRRVVELPVSVHGKSGTLPATFARGISLKFDNQDDVDILVVVSNEVSGAFLLEAGSIKGANGALVVQQGDRREIFR